MLGVNHNLLFARATCLPRPLGLLSPGKVHTFQSPGQGQAFFLRHLTYLYTGSSDPEGTAPHKCIPRWAEQKAMGSASLGNFLEEAIIDQGQEGIVGMGEHSR